MKRNRFVKKITLWIRGGGILLLSNISLVSVGFASWTIGGATSADAEIKITVDDLIHLDEVFQIQQPKMFSYCPYGIIRDETIVSDGYIYFPILIKTTHEDFSKVKKNDDGGLTFSVAITNTGSFDIFSSSYLTRNSNGEISGSYSANNSDYSDECETDFSSKIDSKTITITLAINDKSLLSNDIYFNTAFDFKFDDFPSVYTQISSAGLSFSINAKADVL